MDCVHHFVIPPPDGSEVLIARCKKCGLERGFKPYNDEHPYWRDFKTDENGRRRLRALAKRGFHIEGEE